MTMHSINRNLYQSIWKYLKGQVKMFQKIYIKILICQIWIIIITGEDLNLVFQTKMIISEKNLMKIQNQEWINLEQICSNNNQLTSKTHKINQQLSIATSYFPRGQQEIIKVNFWAQINQHLGQTKMKIK